MPYLFLEVNLQLSTLLKKDTVNAPPQRDPLILKVDTRSLLSNNLFLDLLLRLSSIVWFVLMRKMLTSIDAIEDLRGSQSHMKADLIYNLGPYS